MKLLFIDESGNHNLTPGKIDSEFPIFVLTGIVMDKNNYVKTKRNILNFKKDFFGTKRVILHARELTRPSITKQKELATLTNKERRKKFYKDLDREFAKAKFKIINFYIDKPFFVDKYGETAPDPYFFSFNFIFKNFRKMLKKHEAGKIIAETRGKVLDKKFILAWENSNLPKKFAKIDAPQLVSKSPNIVGIEMADLICYRLARALLGKTKKPLGNEINLTQLKTKEILISGQPENLKL